MSTAIIFDLKKYSIHDGPGIRTTVFFKGCPLRCWWCHNPEGQSPRVELLLRPSRCIRCGACVEACPNGAVSWDGDRPLTDRQLCQHCGVCTETCFAEARQLAGRQMELNQVLAEIEADRPFYEASGGGVTLSGGEPLFQSEFARQLLAACQQRDLHTALDTCGFAAWEVLDSLRACVDLFLYDIKLVDDRAHQRYTGVSNRLILENLRRLSALGHAIRLRVPLIPGINDDPPSLEGIARLAAGLPVLQGLDLLPYHRLGADKYARLEKAYPLAAAEAPGQERMQEIAYFIESHGLPVNIGG
jgi:pyruvate formate lyase activating enzyme